METRRSSRAATRLKVDYKEVRHPQVDHKEMHIFCRVLIWYLLMRWLWWEVVIVFGNAFGKSCGIMDAQFNKIPIKWLPFCTSLEKLQIMSILASPITCSRWPFQDSNVCGIYLPFTWPSNKFVGSRWDFPLLHLCVTTEVSFLIISIRMVSWSGCCAWPFTKLACHVCFLPLALFNSCG